MPLLWCVSADESLEGFGFAASGFLGWSGPARAVLAGTKHCFFKERFMRTRKMAVVAAATCIVGGLGILAGCQSSDSNTGRSSTDDTGMYDRGAGTAGSRSSPNDPGTYGGVDRSRSTGTYDSNGNRIDTGANGTGTSGTGTYNNNRTNTGTGNTGSSTGTGTGTNNGTSGTGTGTSTGGTGTGTSGAGGTSSGTGTGTGTGSGTGTNTGTGSSGTGTSTGTGR